MMDFSKVHNIAIVGLSDKEDRPSYQVARYLQDHGFRIIPVNPAVETILGEKAYPDLEAIPADIPIDIVDVFRRAEAVPPIVDAAIKRGVPVIWLQEGVVHEEAAARARAAGLEVIMDRCIKKEHLRSSNPL
ncbi:predicted CoA-binding protein [Moorella thermoacetica Y72]|uniref:Predicted CoA-binding protein n=2 Tax=Neomoorella thermoacetica TaxID=1525 RepID=A0A0S6UAA4_NEOTH|nr:CoA-binding protein [Moorella thermoacetica]GAF25653.1 predicted CoA-binding protein [Moorella thermoacetica Y72]